MTHLALTALRLYRQTIGRAFAGRCKYHPSCSQYALDAFTTYGAARGAALALWRLVRCNPWSHGGVDYVHDQRVFHRHRSNSDQHPAAS